MNTLTVLLVLFLFVGAFQGMVFGVILLRSKNNRISNKILATILFLLSYRLLVQIMRLFGLGYYDTWYYFMLDLSWVTGPLLYFYVKAQIDSDYKISKKDYFHFLPLVLQIAISIFVRLQNLYWEGTRESLSWLGYWGYVVWMNYPTIYIIASLLIIYYANLSLKLLKKEVNIDSQKLHWIKRIIFSFKIYFSLVLSILLVDLLVYKVVLQHDYFYFIRFFYYPFFIGISVLIYWLGIEGFSRRNERKQPVKTRLSEEDRVRLEVIAKDLKKIVKENELFKIQKLNLNSLADELKIKPYVITQCLNEVIGKKFNDFINEYRVKEVQNLLENPENSKYTLLSLAMEAGFNSKSSFNRAVQKHLGVSPRELKRDE
ncbi:helix-turn-helix domain-containing protein [Tenacibaculum sp. MEBiC06402]|uniref:helix-turn-helix domain-containing protein n=1 Tax=unclassified Tenacibaculum TaxID=2635139 RepID=UPI003B9A9D0C